VKNLFALQKFLTPINIVDFDYRAAVEYGKIRALLKKKGTPIGPMDMLIAACAKSRGLTLFSNNLKDFSRIESLSLENWV
jgi:tRNA(fMet)-specific endonuclease VapC